MITLLTISLLCFIGLRADNKRANKVSKKIQQYKEDTTCYIN